MCGSPPPNEAPALPASAAGPLSRVRGRAGEGAGPDQPSENTDDPAPRALILFYRSQWLAGDTAAVDGLCAALEARGMAARPIFLSSLKDPQPAPSCARRSSFTRRMWSSPPPPLRRERRRTFSPPVAPWCFRPSPAPPHGRPGATAPAGSRRPTLPCMWCCRNWTAGFWPAPSPSRMGPPPTPTSPSPRH